MGKQTNKATVEKTNLAALGKGDFFFKCNFVIYFDAFDILVVLDSPVVVLLSIDVKGRVHSKRLFL